MIIFLALVVQALPTNIYDLSKCALDKEKVEQMHDPDYVLLKKLI